MQKKVISIGVPLTISIFFLFIVLSSGGCVFNLLPYEIHESFLSEQVGESEFIKAFDIVFAIALYLVFYWILNRMLRTRNNKPK